VQVRCSAGVVPTSKAVQCLNPEDSSANLCHHGSLKSAKNGAFKLVVITYLQFVIHSHHVTGRVFSGPSSPQEYVVENCEGFSRGYGGKSCGLWI
jgi:hypothetical protein